MSKKLQEKQQRRLFEEQKRAEAQRAARRRNLWTLGLALAVTALVVWLVINERAVEETGTIGVPLAEADCGDVEEFEDQGQDHIEPGTEHEPYNSNPPTSGPHLQSPAALGFYPPGSALPAEQLVHNLEHGQIVIWYRPDISDSALDALEQIADDEPSSTVVAPYDGIEGSVNYVVTAWTFSQGCVQVSEEAINEFRRDHQGKSPEPLTPPFRG